jgi:hypothetical protein
MLISTLDKLIYYNGTFLQGSTKPLITTQNRLETSWKKFARLFQDASSRSKISMGGTVKKQENPNTCTGNGHANRVARFFSVKHTKWSQNAQNGRKNLPTGHKMYQRLPLRGPPKFTQNWNFLVWKYSMHANDFEDTVTTGIATLRKMSEFDSEWNHF